MKAIKTLGEIAVMCIPFALLAYCIAPEFFA
jgi:hypothetical protein